MLSALSVARTLSGRRRNTSVFGLLSTGWPRNAQRPHVDICDLGACRDNGSTGVRHRRAGHRDSDTPRVTTTALISRDLSGDSN